MCHATHMATNLHLDDKLVQEALSIGGLKTKRATVEEALREFILRRSQRKVTEVFGKIDFDPSFDYKVQRERV